MSAGPPLTSEVEKQLARAESQLALYARIEPSQGKFPVRGDDRKLYMVLQVLLENALKFSRAEKVIRVRLAMPAGKVSLTVAGSGVGIPPEMASEVFRPFTVLDIAHPESGTGLSLALAEAILKAHHGSIRLEARGVGRSGGGSTSIIERPAAAGDLAEAERP